MKDMNAEINFNLPGNKKSEHNSRDKIAVVYARYSSHSQTEQSIEGQLAAAQTYAAAHDYTIVHEYIDRAKSGRTDSREQFQAMLHRKGLFLKAYLKDLQNITHCSFLKMFVADALRVQRSVRCWAERICSDTQPDRIRNTL